MHAMNSYDEIIDYVKKHDGIFLRSELINNKISKYYINRLIRDGIIEKYDHGVYVRCDILEDEFYILQRKNPTIIYSHHTAMYLHQLSDRAPIQADATVYKGYNTSHLPKNINVHFCKKEVHHLGTTKIISSQGFEITVYNLERTTCDMIRSGNNNKDNESVNKFIRTVFLQHKLDTIKLIEYAKKLNCEEKVRQIMEVFS